MREHGKLILHRNKLNSKTCRRRKIGLAELLHDANV